MELSYLLALLFEYTHRHKFHKTFFPLMNPSRKYVSFNLRGSRKRWPIACLSLHAYQSQEPCLFIQNIIKNISWCFVKKKIFEENANFWARPWVNPFGKRYFFNYAIRIFSRKSLLFCVEQNQTIYLKSFPKKNNFSRNCQHLTKIMG